MSDSVWPHRRQPTRLPHPWDSPGKNTGVACHFLFQCMKVKSESEVAQSCPTPSNPMDCSLPGSSIHGIFQARVLEWGAIAFSEWSHQDVLTLHLKSFQWLHVTFQMEASLINIVHKVSVHINLRPTFQSQGTTGPLPRCTGYTSHLLYAFPCSSHLASYHLLVLFQKQARTSHLKGLSVYLIII